ncbi:sigma-70 family RNA polymerase sigma factor [Amycolatopsis keratiniphila]|uniref:sigma-70 family RNA polymerase sigma factor n=1 Tax=Amycolatopsis keratiniphila TaxID=129921 RepID=UPI00087A7D8B|nr:sigma-70 family RNA polymerase sigma factor [Amycolatopsis keratiniphila]OLZ56980.1 RNA polymerase subunit sigma [Amycolatopsis keratiniphila subsp. nogabecina]SDU49012.1 RNA polymerase sigma factor, sigma-70 family [Amycolatopsis keratiniphila]
MSTVPADLSGKSDAELIAEVRDGKIASYGTLYERHAGAAHNLARQLARSSSEADDLVSEAFAKVLDTLRGGKGPDAAFRAYLLTALRHTAYDKTRKDKRVDLNEDMSDVGGAVGEALTVPFSDTAVAGLERTLAAKAFARLPERWQAVLWHTEIEGQTPAEVAPLLGLTANGVSALAYRAREGLRQAYLQVHLAENSAERCRASADKLGAWTRDGLSKRERAQVESHLDECEKCRALAAELADVNTGLRGIIAPIVLGGAALGYLATTGAGKAGAVTAAATAAAAGSTSGGAAGAAAAGPRQFAGVAGSGAAIVAAVAVALAAGGGTQEIPAAAAVPPPAVAPPTAPPPPPPPGPPAAPPGQQPVPPAQQAPPPAQPPAPAPAPGPSPSNPAPPTMTASTPPDGVQLKPGEPANLPITVRNNGGSKSEPVAVSLNLPQGVRAVPAGGGGAMGAGGFRQQAPATIAVSCPGGTGTVTCRTGTGLEPGQSAVLTFRLLADETARDGSVVTGSVTAGARINVRVEVQVKVPPRPKPPEPKPPRDDLTLTAKSDDLSAFPWNRNPLVMIRVTNTGESTKPVTITLDHRVLNSWSVSGIPCTPTGEGASCTSRGSLKPGRQASLWVRLKGRPPESVPVTVNATLGSAKADPARVYFDCWRHWCDDNALLPPTTVPSLPSVTSKPSAPPETTKPGRPGWPVPTKKPSPAVTPSQPVQQEPAQPTTTTSAPPQPGKSKPSTRPNGVVDRVFQ